MSKLNSLVYEQNIIFIFPKATVNCTVLITVPFPGLPPYLFIVRLT